MVDLLVLLVTTKFMDLKIMIVEVGLELDLQKHSMGPNRYFSIVRWKYHTNDQLSFRMGNPGPPRIHIIMRGGVGNCWCPGRLDGEKEM